jgi:hypothetical protein
MSRLEPQIALVSVVALDWVGQQVLGPDPEVASLLHFSTLLALLFLVISHFSQPLEYIVLSLDRMVRLLCVALITLAFSLRLVYLRLKDIDTVPQEKCVCGSGRLFKNCNHDRACLRR